MNQGRKAISQLHLEVLEPRRLLSLGTLSEQIIVDQFGWRADAGKKVAIFADPIGGQNAAITYIPGATFEVRRASDDGLVFTGTTVAWRSGQTHGQSQDRVWSGDFSSLTTPGEYYVYDSASGLRSYNFRLDNNLFDDILKTSIRVFYYQRDGQAIPAQYGGNWNRAASHLGPNQDTQALLHTSAGAIAGTARDVSGGWFDAGDINRYVPWTANVLWDLLFAYEGNPGVFGDDTNIPESGNTVPDVLDEAKWELDWLLKMQFADGSVASRVGGLEYPPAGGPAADTQPRYYTPASTWATSSLGIATAYASRVFAQFDWQYPGYAAILRNAAEKAWDYLTATPAMTPSSGTDGGNILSAEAGVDANGWDDKRFRVDAAAELFKTTGDAKYKSFFEAHYKDSDTTASWPGGTHHPLLGDWPHFDPSLATDLNRALVTYTTTPGASPSIVAEIKTSLGNMVDGQIVPAYTNQDDPYRAYMWDGHYCWGSNRLKSDWANMLTYALRLGLNHANDALYREIAEEYLHYFHGRNPLSQIYLSNMGGHGANLGGEKSVMEVFHDWFLDGNTLYDGQSSQYGPAPGYLVGGPNQYFGVNFVSPPYGEPAQKAFKDWNTTWNYQYNTNENSWEITEPAIYYQSAYSLLLSQFATDTHAPTTAAGFAPAGAPRVTLQFSEDVGSTLVASDLVLDNLTSPGSGAQVSSLQYDGATHRAIVQFSPGLLPDGNYRLTLKSGSIADPAGNATDTAWSYDFFQLRGDANRDRAVNFADLVKVSQNYKKTSATWEMGDFNDDGVVNFADLVAVSQQYKKSLPAPVQLQAISFALTTVDSLVAADAAPVSAAGTENWPAPMGSTSPRTGAAVAPVPEPRLNVSEPPSVAVETQSAMTKSQPLIANVINGATAASGFLQAARKVEAHKPPVNATKAPPRRTSSSAKNTPRLRLEPAPRRTQSRSKSARPVFYSGQLIRRPSNNGAFSSAIAIRDWLISESPNKQSKSYMR